MDPGGSNGLAWPLKVIRRASLALEVLPDLETWDFVFVRDDKKAVAGIITTADVVGI